MNKVILVFGPSGVGKSTACMSLIGRLPDVSVAHLDRIAAEFAYERGWIDRPNIHLLDASPKVKLKEHFLAIGLQAITATALRAPDKHHVIDVGSGFTKAHYSTRLPYLYPSIALTADPEKAYARWQQRPRDADSPPAAWTLVTYTDVEFDQHNMELFRRCANIDTNNKSAAEVGELLTAQVRAVVG